ncbi:MAG: hypothetical protein HDQ87_11990 [Clostridia bacterium]|nr:hypothetical protein [Clostridia bacterium]
MIKMREWCRTAGSFFLAAVLLISALVVATGAAPAAGPQLAVKNGSGLRIESQGGTDYLLGWSLPPTGSFTAGNYLAALEAAPAGHEIMICHGTGSDSSQLASDDFVSTGDEIRLVNLDDDSIPSRLSVVILGDVLGTGTMDICQIDQLRGMVDVNAVETAYEHAADMNSDGRINNDDLLAATQILTANRGVSGQSTEKAPQSLTPQLTVEPSDTVKQGDQITIRMENAAFGAEALIDVDPTQLRYEGNSGLGTSSHVVLTAPGGSNDYSVSEYTYTVLAKPGTVIGFYLKNTVVRAGLDARQPMSVANDPWLTLVVDGDALAYSPEACPTVSGPETTFVGENISIQVVMPADATDSMARVTTSGLQFLSVEADGSAAAESTESSIDWRGGSRVLTYNYKVTAPAGDPVRFVLSDTVSYLTTYGAPVTGGQTSWSARVAAGTSNPMITLRKPVNGALSASFMETATKPTPTPAPTTTQGPAATPTPDDILEVLDVRAAADPAAKPSFSTAAGNVSFRTYAKGDYVCLTAQADEDYVLSNVTAVSGDYTLNYDRRDSRDGTGRFGVDGKFFVLSRQEDQAELRFTVPALDVVVTATYITKEEAAAQDAAGPSPSPSPSLTPTPSPSESASLSPSPSATASVSADPSGEPSTEPSETLSPSPSPSGDVSSEPSASASEEPTPTPTPSPSVPATRTPAPSHTPAPSYDIDVQEGSGLHVGHTTSGLPYVGGRGLMASREGTYVRDFMSLINGPVNGTLDVVTEDGREVGTSALASTGQVLEARSENGELLDHAYVVVKGDILGTGKASIAQLTAVADALIGHSTLTGVRKEAADMNENGTIDIGDLVTIAHMLVR